MGLVLSARARFGGTRHAFDLSPFRPRELSLFALADVGEIGTHDPLGVARSTHPSAVEPQRLVAESLHEVERVGHQQNRPAAPLELAELVEALVGEPRVADREHLVDQQHVGIDMDGDGKPEPHVHPGRVRLHRRVDEVLQFRELDNLVKPPADVALAEAEHDAVDEDVLAAGNLGVKSGPQLDEGRDSSLHLHGSGRGFRNAGDKLERGALPRSVPADDGVGPARGYAERHALERRKRFFGLQILNEAALQQGALQRRELLPSGVPAVHLRDVGQLDRVHGTSPHTSSANESRRRSNRKYANRNSSPDPTVSASSHFQWPKSPSRYRIS